jgi:hypothetical protein
LLAGYLLSYISIIRGAVVDALFYRVYQYVSLNLLHIADVEECLSKQLDLKHHFLRLIP